MHRGRRRKRSHAPRLARGLGSLILLAVMVFMPAVVMADDFPGTSGDDDITGTSGDDTIDGGDGNDDLNGSGGEDTVEGGSGADSVHGGDDNDHVYGDSADEPGQLVGGNDSSVLGTAGNDNVYGDGVASGSGGSGSTPDLIGGNDAQVEGDDGADTIYGDGRVTDAAGEEGVLDGGDDQIWGDSPNPSVLEDDDVIYGDGIVIGDLGALLLGGNDTINGGGGNDFIVGDGYADDIGNDQVATLEGGDDTIDGGDGHDRLFGDGGADGPNTIADVLGGNDTIHGGSGNDEIWGEGINFALVPFEGNDQLSGDAGNDTIFGQSGSDTIDGGADNDVVAGEAVGHSESFTGDDDLGVSGGAGNDTVFGDGSVGRGDVFAPDGSSLVGGHDTADGGEGHDLVYGDGNIWATDEGTLVGGNDTVRSGGNTPYAGPDPIPENEYDFLWGDGNSICNLDCSLQGGMDSIIGTSGEEGIAGDGNVSGGTSATLVGGDDTVDAGAGDDNMRGDGHALTTDAAGTATLEGGVDNIDSGAGDDNIEGDGGAEGAIALLIGGNDGTGSGGLLDGGEGDDSVLGDGKALTDQAAGSATLTGGVDTVLGGAGNDEVIGDGIVTALTGALGSTTTLTGGEDTIDGGAGSDTAQGDGVIDNHAAGGTSVLDGGDDIIINAGGNGDGFIRHHSGSSGAAILNGGNDTITGQEIADVIYGDGQIHNSGTDISRLNGGDDVIDGAGGDDKLVGDGWINDDPLTALITGGNDTLRGGDGNDTLWGEWGNVGIAQTITGGDDRLYGEAGNDTIFGQSGNDLLLGGEGDDTLDGGTGSDFLCGGSGTDTVKGGSGADLQCAVDDAITVTEDGGSINVAVNEELDDADAADRAGRRYEIISISGDIKAVIDTETGRLTIFEADSDGQIQYRVWLIDGSFETFGTVFVALSRTQEEPEEEEDPPPDVVDPVDVIPVTPVVDPLDPLDPLDPVEPVAPADPVTPQDDTKAVNEDVLGENVPPAIEDPTHKSESVQEFLRGPLAPAVTAGVTGTMMMAVTGGAGVSAAGLTGGAGSSGGGGGAAARGERQGGRSRGPRAGGGRAAGGGGGGAVSRYDGTSDRVLLAATGVGIGPGDRSRTWRLAPGRRAVDRASTKLPGVFAPHSPLLARLAVDGAHLRAMFGSLWMVAPAIGAILGVLATNASGGRPIAPPLWILIAGAVLTTIDAFAGAVAATVYITAGVVTGALIDDYPPDLVHSLLVYCAISFLWTSIPLIGSALRPFRRLGRGDFRYAWDVVADLAIASLLCAWITRSLMGAMDSFAGTETGLPAHADIVALVVLGCVAVRILIEHITTRFYPLRLQSVEALGDLPEPTLLASLSGIAIRTALFAFIGYSFIGASWHWWAGVAFYVVPQVLSVLGAEFDRIDALQKLLPRGITAVFVLLLVAALVIHVATSRTSSDLETMRWVFMLLALPPAVLGVLEAFAPDSDQETSWTREFLGLGVVVGSAYLAFNGWNL